MEPRRPNSRSRSRVRSRTRSPVHTQPSYDGSRPYERQHSTSPPVVIFQQPDYQGYHGHQRATSSSPSRDSYHGHGYGRTSTYHGRSRRTSYIARHGPSSAESGSLPGDYGREQAAFTAVDPFRPSVASSVNFAPQTPSYQSHFHHHSHLGGVHVGAYRTPWRTLLADFKLVWTFLFDTLPRQFYLYFLLRLPALYFSRVARIFEEADMTMSEIKGMALATLVPMTNPNVVISDCDHAIPALNSRLKTTWEGFIDSLLKEWKTLNIVSVLLLTAILTILQIPGASNDPIARHAALISLICALMSLLYGCMYIIRFGSMRKTYKAAEWAAEAQKSKTLIWWNVWVLLAMPAIWLAWSIVLYIVCIMAFVWRSGTSDESYSPLSKHAALGPRIVISAVLALGVIYFLLILNTFRRYGDIMDKAWGARIANLARDKLSHEKRHDAYSDRSWQPYYQRRGHLSSPRITVVPIYPQEQSRPASFQTSTQESKLQIPKPVQPPRIPIQVLPSRSRSRSMSPPQKPRKPNGRDRSPLPPVPRLGNDRDWSNPDYNGSIVPVQIDHSMITMPVLSSYGVFFTSLKVMDLRFQVETGTIMPDILCRRNIHAQDWIRFIYEASDKWNGNVPLFQRKSRSSPLDDVVELVEKWNLEFFDPRGTRAYLCADSFGLSIYLVDWLSPNGEPLNLEERFGSLLESGRTISIYDPLPSDIRTFSGDPIFSERHRVRGEVDDWITLRSYPELAAPPATPVTVISRSSTSSTSERRSRWSRSPPRLEQRFAGVPNGEEASITPRARSPSSALPATSTPSRPIDQPMQPPDSYTEIRKQTHDVPLYATDTSQAVQQPVKHPHSSSHVADIRRGRPQVTFSKTDPSPRVVSGENPSSSQRHSAGQPSRYRYRHRSIPVGYGTQPSGVTNAESRLPISDTNVGMSSVQTQHQPITLAIENQNADHRLDISRLQKRFYFPPINSPKRGLPTVPMRWGNPLQAALERYIS